MDLKLPPRGPIDRPDVAKRLGSMTEDGMNPAWESLDEDRRADLARRMAVYAAMVENMDRNIGRIVTDLKERGELENTLILFLSDNGACAEWEPFGFDLDREDYAGNKPGFGINGGTPNKPNILHRGDELQKMGGMTGSLFSYGSAWANACNTPLSYYKHYAHEGGIRTPMIAHWPAGIKGSGEFRPHVSHVMDVMATCVELGNATYPESFGKNEILPLEGRSLASAFSGKPDEPRTLVFEHEHNIAIREGDWKLVGENGLLKTGLNPEADWRLYDLSGDPAEQRNIAPENTDFVGVLKTKMLEEARRTMVLPAP